MDEDNFGQRLQRARTAAGLSRAEVATALALRRTDVARIEHGRRRVSTHELGKLARLYRKPSARCLLEPAGAPPIRSFRSDYRLDERDLIVIEELGDWLAYYAWLERAALGAQRYEFPTYPLSGGNAVEQGECLAAEERNRLGLGDGDAVPSMVALLEREGVKVAVQAFHPRSRAFGCYLFSEPLGPCAIVNRDRAAAERRFAAAHEYAHLLVDQEDISGGVCGPFRAHELDELRAGAFATAFLLPPGGIAARLEDLDAPDEVSFEQVVRLGYHFGASYGAVVARLADLGWIDARCRAHLERRGRAIVRHAPPGRPDARGAHGTASSPGTASSSGRSRAPGTAGPPRPSGGSGGSGGSGTAGPPGGSGTAGTAGTAGGCGGSGAPGRGVVDGEPGDTESEPVRFRSVAVEAWHCGQISTGKLADLLDLPEADVALLLNHSLLEHERSHRVPSAEPDRL